MTREEAAARAVAKDEDASNWDEEKPWYQNGWLGRVDTILAAADAHDAANGVHRVSMDDATVERAARAWIESGPLAATWEGTSDRHKKMTLRGNEHSGLPC